jgi:hypothetical protein
MKFEKVIECQNKYEAIEKQLDNYSTILSYLIQCDLETKSEIFTEIQLKAQQLLKEKYELLETNL